MTWARCAVVLSIAFLAAAAASAEAAGVLVPRDGSPAIRVRSHRVMAVVEDGIARTTVRQTFVNPHGRALEGVYVFPVPEGAALVDLAMETGGQRLEGLLAERKTARRAYDRLVHRRIDPALVEQIGRSKFRLSVFPVLPDQPTVVEMTWIQAAPVVGGETRYVYPLAEAGEAARTEEDLTVSVTLRSSATLLSITSPVDGMSASLDSTHEARASFERNGVTLDRDLAVVAKVASAEPSLAVRTFRGASGDPYFAAVVTPPDLPEERTLPRDVTLLLDASGSMAGGKFEQARASAGFLLDRLRPRDRVNVLLFSDEVLRFADAPVPARPENLARLRRFVAAARAGGGTALGNAVRAAAAAPTEEGRVAMLVLLTDGRPTMGATDPAEILEAARAGSARGLRVFAFGVGDDVDVALLEGLVQAGGGAAEVFRPEGEVESRLHAFLVRTAAPALSGLRLEIDGRRIEGVLPDPLLDVFLGEQAVITGRAALSGRHEFVVRAVLDGREVALRAEVDVPPGPGGAASVRDLWARRRIDSLERAHRMRLALDDEAYFAALDRGAYSTADELVRAMIDVSLESGVQCGHTSFFALLPEDRARLDPRDAEELARALDRANAKRREIAGLPPSPGSTESVFDDPDRPEVEASRPTEESRGVTEDPVHFDAKISDHHETDNDRETEESLGDPRFVSDSPFEGPGANGTIGIGGGAGGAFGGRRGGHRNPRASGGGRKSQSAVDLALGWLRDHQSLGGRWHADGFGAKCPTEKCPHPGDVSADVYVTGLSLLAFLGCGETHQSGIYKDTVKEALKYLKNVQDRDGCFGPRTARQFLSDHMVASLAMSEAYGLTQSVLFKDSAQRAVNFVHATRHPYLAWRHGVQDDASDVTLTAWAALALKTADMAELEVDRSALWRVPAALDRITDPATGRVSSPTRIGPLYVDPARGTMFGRLSDGTAAAAALVARVVSHGTAGGDPAMDADPLVARGADFLLTRLPRRDAAEFDLLHVYFGTIAMRYVGYEHWPPWNESLLATVVPSQRAEAGRHTCGSWDPVGPWGTRGGRVAATAMNCLCMEIYYGPSAHVRRR